MTREEENEWLYSLPEDEREKIFNEEFPPVISCLLLLIFAIVFWALAGMFLFFWLFGVYDDSGNLVRYIWEMPK